MTDRGSKRRTSRNPNANVKVPKELTDDLRAFIDKLPDSPEVIYLKEQVWSKFCSSETDPPELRKQRAIEKWLATEERNAETNVRLAFTPEDYHILPRVHYSTFVEKCASIISSIIGDTPSDTALIGSFSGGASTCRMRTESHPAQKYFGKADITESAADLFGETLSDIEAWLMEADHGSRWTMEREMGFDPTLPATEGLTIRTVSANHMFTVPKNTLIDRCACKEPRLNMFMQKGLGNQIRSGLRRAGINLNDQSINRRLAQAGSLTGQLATLDLSSASDSVCWELVFQLLPSTWFTLLEQSRSSHTLIGDELHENEMFSSMGNGFTFELESLLFYALARTTAYFRGVSGVISVYGDDIIVPVSLAEDLIWVLQYFGFSVNPEKSFWTGPFRESCGGHYHSGFDITPFYIRRPITYLTDLIRTANAVRSWACRGEFGIAMFEEIFPLWEYLAHHVPEYLWGGHDLDDITRLVTTDQTPRKRLQPVNEKSDTGVGGYMMWLNSCWVRENGIEEAIETSYETKTGEFYRLRPARKSSFHTVSPWLHEIAVK